MLKITPTKKHDLRHTTKSNETHSTAANDRMGPPRHAEACFENLKAFFRYPLQLLKGYAEGTTYSPDDCQYKEQWESPFSSSTVRAHTVILSGMPALCEGCCQ